MYFPKNLVCLVAFVGALALAGCRAGPAGAPGPEGQKGADGNPGPDLACAARQVPFWTGTEWGCSDPAWLDVRGFGAKGDSIDASGALKPAGTDDTVAIQTALDLAGTPGHSATVYLPSGGYTISDSLHLRSGTSLVGDGPASALLRKVDGAPFDMLVVDAKSSILIEKLRVDGVATLDPAVPANRFAGIRIHRSDPEAPGPTDVTVRDVECTRTTHGEIQAEGTRACLVAEDATRITLDRVHVHDNRGSGIFIARGSEHCTVTGSSLHDNITGSGITGNGYEHLIVAHNQVYRNDYTNISVNGPRSMIVGNVSRDSQFAGITIGHDNPQSVADDTVCTGNHVSGNQLGGIYVSNSNRVLIADNQVSENELAGIRFAWQTGGTAIGECTVRGNQIFDNNGSGILIGWGAGHVFQANVISGNSGSGIYVDGGTTTPLPVGRSVFKDNVLRDNGATAIQGGLVFVNAPGLCSQNVIEKGAGSAASGIVAAQPDSQVEVFGNLFGGAYTLDDAFLTAAGGAFANRQPYNAP